MPSTPFGQPSIGTPQRGYNTKEFGAIVRAEPQTIRVSLCEKGHYLGVRPVKLPNRRLLWPADQVDAVARGEQPAASKAAA